MPLVLEDGTGLASANSYVSETDADTYFDDRATTDWTGDTTSDKEAALIRASAAIDATYRARFPGWRSNGRDQGLEWPRTNAYDYEGLPVDGVPVEIINATCEAALIELTDPGAMTPDLERGGQIRAMSAGSVSIEYAAAASATTTRTLIDGILSSLLGPTTMYSARAVRG